MCRRNEEMVGKIESSMIRHTHRPKTHEKIARHRNNQQNVNGYTVYPAEKE